MVAVARDHGGSATQAAGESIKYFCLVSCGASVCSSATVDVPVTAREVRFAESFALYAAGRCAAALDMSHFTAGFARCRMLLHFPALLPLCVDSTLAG